MGPSLYLPLLLTFRAPAEWTSDARKLNYFNFLFSVSFLFERRSTSTNPVQTRHVATMSSTEKKNARIARFIHESAFLWFLGTQNEMISKHFFPQLNSKFIACWISKSDKICEHFLMNYKQTMATIGVLNRKKKCRRTITRLERQHKWRNSQQIQMFIYFRSWFVFVSSWSSRMELAGFGGAPKTNIFIVERT